MVVSAAALSVAPRSGRRKLRAAVFERDRGVCALCKFDTEKLADSLAGARKSIVGSLGGATLYRATIQAHGIPSGGIYWEADHIVPISEGGADTLDNLRTLCAVGADGGCHGKATRELAARRARKPMAKR